MSTISVRLPESLHKAVRELASKENVSINQFIALALTEKISALMAEDYIKERGERGSRVKFEAAFSKVSDKAPDEEDRL